MSFTVTFECPKHPQYAAKIRPADGCKWCLAMFAGRNKLNAVLSEEREERDTHAEQILKDVKP
jgi:hypothetical protein